MSKDFALLCVSSFLVLSSYFVFLPTISLYVKSLGADDATVGLVVGVLFVSSVICRLVVGPLADRWGRKPLYAFSAIVLLASSLLFNVATTVPALLALRLLQGVGYGVAQTVSAVMVIDLAPMQRRVEAIGWNGMAINIGIGLMGPLALALIGVRGFVISEYNLVFSVGGFLGLLGLFCLELIRETRPIAVDCRQPFGHAFRDVINLSALPPSLAMFLLNWTLVSFMTFLSIHAPAQSTAAYFFVYSLAMFASRAFTGFLADRFGRVRVGVPAGALMVASGVVLGLSTDLVPVIVAGVLFGVGFGAAYAALFVLATESTTPARRGSAVGTFTAGFDLPWLVAAIALGWVANFAGYPPVFFTGAAVGLLGVIWLVGYYTLGSKRRPSPSPS